MPHIRRGANKENKMKKIMSLAAERRAVGRVLAVGDGSAP